MTDQLKFENARREVEDLAALLRRYQKEYYTDGHTSVSDTEYDRLFDRLAALEGEYPDLKSPDSPTMRVGSDLTESFPEVEHSIPVLSLDKAYTTAEVAGWIDRITGRAGRALTFVVEEKIDGVSIVLYYERGLLVRAVTRGNGYVGNDITANVKTIGSVPLRLSEEIDAAVRGEIYLPRDRFESLNRTMENPFANPRNLAAGTLRRIKSSEVARIPLNIFVYEGFFSGENISHLEVLRKLSDLGFRVGSRIGFFSNRLSEEEIRHYNPDWSFGSFEDLPGFIEKSAAERASLEYEIDGLVVKINELDVREELGYTGHHPRWAIAFKFESPQGITTIRSIDVQVGRTGRITPVARVEPVQIGGSTISNVTLHNQDYIDMLEISPGDEVAVSRRGDVIPAVEKVTQKNEAGIPVWKMPDRCPSCGSSLQVVGAHHFCRNNECPDQVRGRLFFFVGRDQMDIENLGPETVELLINKGYVHDLPDLYRFDYEKLLDQPGFGEKKVTLIKKGLQKSLNQPFRVVLPSLGIPEVGKNVSELLIDAGYTDIDMIFDLVKTGSPETLVDIKGIGEKTARTIFEEFSRQELRSRIDELRSLGLQFAAALSPEAEGGERDGSEPGNRLSTGHPFIGRPFAGQTWCVTGSFEHFKPRSKATDLIKAGGGKVTAQVSGSTTHLLAGSAAGSKLQKARDTGASIVGEEGFLRLLSRTNPPPDKPVFGQTSAEESASGETAPGELDFGKTTTGESFSGRTFTSEPGSGQTGPGEKDTEITTPPGEGAPEATTALENKTNEEKSPNV